MEYEQLRGTVETVTYQNEESGFAVLTLCDEQGDLICVVGPVCGAVPGEQLAMNGTWKEHSTYGRQFEAAQCVYQLPAEHVDIVKYLSSGALPGIGAAMARRIVEKFGADSLEIISTQPEKLAAVRGFGLEKAKKASQRFNEMFGLREAMAYLSAIGLTAGQSAALFKIYDTAVQNVVQANPYMLCGEPLYMNFHQADAIAQRLNADRESPKRTQAAILYTIRHNMNNGHTCLPLSKLLPTVSEYFRIQPEQVEEQLEKLVEEAMAFVAEYEGGQYCYLADVYRAEASAAAAIQQMLSLEHGENRDVEKQIRLREQAEGISYAPKQRMAIQEALSRRVLVVTGGPGTGKTTTVNAIISCFEDDAQRVMLCAPTGRAAKRLSEVTGRKAVTIHRLLEVSFGSTMGQPRFARNAQNPLRCDVLIVDEMSMVDCMLFESLMAALRPGCRVVLVGDSDQLPSVGPGNVLKGLIDSGVVPVVELKDIFRQAAQSHIVLNSHRIVEGHMPVKSEKENDFFFIRAYGTACQKLVCDLVARRLPASYGFDPLRDVQVLCPGRKGPLGTEVLNERLQALLNPPGRSKPEMKRYSSVFRLGDKVMQVKNNYDLPYTRTDGEPGAGAFNGDIGIVSEINPAGGSLTVLCEDRYVYYTTENLNELELAYAITIHKSQGSEFEAVVIPVTEVPPRLRYRNLLYTGVTRGRRLCVLAGEDETLAEMVNNGRKSIRFSCFAGLLKDKAI